LHKLSIPFFLKGNFMPRLVGKQSNRGLYVGLVGFAAIAVAVTVAMEYFGVVNAVPGFGKDRQPIGQVQLPAKIGTTPDLKV
jgi:hypothetical protein